MAVEEGDLYSVLGLTAHASDTEIRRSYQRLAKECHPDKLSSDLTKEQERVALSRFHCISKAYGVLSDREQRTLYDTHSQSDLMTQKLPLSDIVDLDDMTFDPALETYSLSCRCGGHYIISEREMEGGVEVACCSTCTLCVRVLYQLAENEKK